VEGPTGDPEVVELRARQSRALLTTLLVSFGVPLLLGGDELGRTQGGNNNAYCQDNEISWLDWSQPDQDLLAFTRRLVALRRAHPVFRRRRFLVGMEAAELAWFTPAGTPMTGENWADPNARALAIYLDGDDAPDLGEDGAPLLDDDFLVLVNGWWEKLQFRVPDIDEPRAWRTELDTYDPGRAMDPPDLHAGDDLTLGPGSILVLQAAAAGS
jgi:glycogen operon protein